jgi:flagellar basal-body rod protein FlgB
VFILNTPGFRMIERSLDAATMRQKVIANNVANVDTPNFKRSDVRFEEYLRNEVNGMMSIEGRRTDPRHFFIGQSADRGPEVVADQNSVMNNNNNNVDIDTEMSQMASNQLRYNVLIQQMNHDIRLARTAIDRGK